MKRIAYFAALMIALPSAALAQYREESGALEQIYESRVRAALNTILRPNEYSLVVAADIDRDPKRLEKLEEDMDKMSLPGVPGLQMAENFALSNKLHELRSRVDVHLILDQGVSAAKEDTAKALVRMKIHLDESAGDTLTTTRASLLPMEKPIEPDLLPEVSWRMWMLFLVLGLLAAGVILMMMNRKQRRADEIDLKKSAEEEMKPLPSIEETPEEAVAAAEESAAPVVAALDPNEHDKQVIELYERKKALLHLSTEYPEAASAALSEHFSRGHEKDVLLACESLGWEMSKKLYHDLHHRVWARLGMMMTERQSEPTTIEILDAVTGCHRAVVARYLDLVDGDESNPFNFVFRLTEKDRDRLLRQESPASLALICVHASQAQMTQMLNTLADDRRQAVLLQLTRLTEVPNEIIRSTVESLRARLAAQKEKPSVELDGLRMTLDLLERIEPEAEAQFLERLRLEHAEEFAALRQVHLLFEDLSLVPAEWLAEGVALLDMKTLTLALAAPEAADIRPWVLGTLPPKRAHMVEKDIAYLRNPSAKDIRRAQRELVKSVSAILKLHQTEPGRLRPLGDVVVMKAVS